MDELQDSQQYTYTTRGLNIGMYVPLIIGLIPPFIPSCDVGRSMLYWLGVSAAMAVGTVAGMVVGERFDKASLEDRVKISIPSIILREEPVYAEE